MNTTELFDFKFVNRDYERNKFNRYFCEHMKNTLWIRGNRGLGKTTFFKDTFSKWNEIELCYFDIKINTNSIEIVADFIKELQAHSSTDFMSMVKKHYNKFYYGVYRETKEITSELFPQITSIVGAILDLSNYIINYADEKRSTLEPIINYIKKLLEEKKICICIDNFSRCDAETASLFFQIFKTFNSDNNFNSCIITTTEDLTEVFQEEIYRNLSTYSIEIKSFDKFEYFYQIMEPIFKLDYFTNDDWRYLYHKCMGSPKKLSTVISKLLEKDGIILYSNDKAIIKKEVLFSILQTEHIRFKSDDFNSQQKWIIFSYLCLPEYVSVEQLIDFALYVANRNNLFRVYNEKLLKEELLNLINNKVLNYKDNNIIPCHDGDYLELMDIFNESQFKGLFSQYAYEFLQNSAEFPEKQALLCYHARNAEIIGWQQMNFLYGKKLVHNKQFYDGYKFFKNIGDYIYKLNEMQILFIAITSYRTGNFRLAIKQLQLLLPKQLRFSSAKYYYFFYLGKSYYNIGEIKKAICELENALKEVSEDSAKYVAVLNVLHMYLLEMPGKQQKSQKIFNKIKESYKISFPVLWANTMRGCHNFMGNAEALDILNEAENLLEDELEKAFLKNTRGYIFIRLNELEKARREYESVCEIVKRLKIHEYSYAANNLALCYMLNRQYNEAYKVLLEALLWNKTNYADLVIQTHLMICSAYLSNHTNTLEYYNNLKNYMENHEVLDAVINRKVYINLAITSRKIGNILSEKAFYQKASKFIRGTSSEWRYFNLTGQQEKCQCNRPTANYQLIEDFEPWFIVYAHD